MTAQHDTLFDAPPLTKKEQAKADAAARKEAKRAADEAAARKAAGLIEYRDLHNDTVFGQWLSLAPINGHAWVVPAKRADDDPEQLNGAVLVRWRKTGFKYQVRLGDTIRLDARLASVGTVKVPAADLLVGDEIVELTQTPGALYRRLGVVQRVEASRTDDGYVQVQRVAALGMVPQWWERPTSYPADYLVRVTATRPVVTA